MRVLIAGGGTGGHFYPALAVMEELSQREPAVKLAYVGTWRGIEARVLPSYPWIRFYPIHARGLMRGHPLQNLYALILLSVAMLETLIVFVRFRPGVVIGMGGYASFPAVLLGSLLGRIFPVRIRTVIHEQNAVAGLTNRLLAPLVDKVLVSYAHSKRFFARAREVVITGNPIRKEFLLAQRTESLYRRFGLDPEKQTVLVFGGSHGSAALTTAVLRAKAAIAQNERLQVLLVTGDSGEERAIRAEFQRAGVENVVVRRYIERMGEAFALADLIVSRAGATTLAEITSCGKPALLVPWGGAADGHQWENARVLDQERACTLVNEEDILGQGLVELIEQVIGDQEGLMQMAQNSMRLGKRQATTLILGEIITLAQGART
jgi:UDP-N-acetylglucosamine--N-acetylmuramyl-(pentapeptide) pyrophosphoryl-undecaprenol N-acetylglucosamine transferase